jgi:hypothetical protein
LKTRPSPFAVQLRLDGSIGSLRIGLNIVSLCHRALSRLPGGAGETQLFWRLTVNAAADVPQLPRIFILPSNKRDPEHDQPQHFLLDLRKEQLRSLSWMLDQETTGRTFIEEEISEAMLPALHWRAEGKVERPVLVRGGVIADQVGYGKTIISLALIAETKDLPAPTPAPSGLIDIKATLIVVPGHLSKQWPSEIERFTGKTFKLVVIQNMRDLQSKSIADLSKADIIVVATEVFELDLYWSRFEYLSAQPEDWLSDKAGGRFFADHLTTAVTSLQAQTRRLQKSADDAQTGLEQAKLDAISQSELLKAEHKTVSFGKRMKGQAYRDRYDGPAKKMKMDDEWEDSDEQVCFYIVTVLKSERRGTDSSASHFPQSDWYGIIHKSVSQEGLQASSMPGNTHV